MDREYAAELVTGMSQRVPSKLIDFGKMLDAAYGGPWFGREGWDGWAYFLEKPWKWSAEYAAWANADYPMEGDDGWHDFADSLNELIA